MAHHDTSLPCGIWSLSGHSGLWPAERPVDLWVHGLVKKTRKGMKWLAEKFVDRDYRCRWVAATLSLRGIRQTAQHDQTRRSQRRLFSELMVWYTAMPVRQQANA